MGPVVVPSMDWIGQYVEQTLAGQEVKVSDASVELSKNLSEMHARFPQFYGASNESVILFLLETISVLEHRVKKLENIQTPAQYGEPKHTVGSSFVLKI